MAKYQYRLTLIRRIAVPEAGAVASRLQTTNVTFEFGKGAYYPTGAKAEQAAMQHALNMYNECSKIYLTRETLQGRGKDFLLKSSDITFKEAADLCVTFP